MKKLLVLNRQVLAAYTLTYSISYIQYPLKEVEEGTLLAFRVKINMHSIEKLLKVKHTGAIKFPGHLILRSTQYIQLFDKQGNPVEYISTPFESMMENGDRDLYKAGFLLEVKEDLDPVHTKKMMPSMELG